MCHRRDDPLARQGKLLPVESPASSTGREPHLSSGGNLVLETFQCLALPAHLLREKSGDTEPRPHL